MCGFQTRLAKEISSQAESIHQRITREVRLLWLCSWCACTFDFVARRHKTVLACGDHAAAAHGVMPHVNLACPIALTGCGPQRGHVTQVCAADCRKQTPPAPRTHVDRSTALLHAGGSCFVFGSWPDFTAEGGDSEVVQTDRSPANEAPVCGARARERVVLVTGAGDAHPVAASLRCWSGDRLSGVASRLRQLVGLLTIGPVLAFVRTPRDYASSCTCNLEQLCCSH